MSEIPGSPNPETLSGSSEDDLITAGDGNDTLIGGAGDDVLRGELGDDTYRFAAGFGADRIEENGDGDESDTDTIIFEADIAPSDVRLVRYGDDSNEINADPALGPLVDQSDLVLVVEATGDQIVINRQYNAPGDVVEQIRFEANDTTLDITRDLTFTGTDGADHMLGGDGNPVSDSNDVLRGLGGDDLIEGDVFSLGSLSGDDTLVGGAGDDVLRGQFGDDTYRFAAGFGADRIEENGDGDESDTDTIIFEADIAPSDVRLVRYGDDSNEINADPALGPLVDQSDLVLVVEATGDQIVINRQYNAPGDVVEQIRFEANDTTLDITRDLTFTGTDGADHMLGGGGNPVSDSNDVLRGLGGDDLIEGDDFSGGSLSGDDTLVGGAGDDVLRGRLGDDTYRFASGFGTDRIEENGSDEDTDTIVFEADIAPSDVRLIRYTLDSDEINSEPEQGPLLTSQDLVVVVESTDDQIIIGGHFNSTEDVVEQIRFEANDTTLDITRDLTFTGTDGADHMLGGEGNPVNDSNDVLRGLGGDDVLEGNSDGFGSGGDDTLIGGTGNDVLRGNVGDDTYRFASGFGTDRIEENGSDDDTDTIVFEADIAPSDVRLVGFDEDDGTVENSGNLSIIVDSTGDRIVIEDHFITSSNAVETIRFEANGSTRDLTTILDGPTADDDSARTHAGSSVVIDVLANDSDPNDGTLSLDSVADASNGTTEITADGQVRYTPSNGFLGIDTFTYTLSDGQGGTDIASVSVEVEQLSRSGTAGADTLEGTAAADVLNGLGGDDLLRGFAGHDELFGGDGSDRLDGGDGNDRIVGGNTDADRRDVVFAGAGDDTANGGHGNDQLNGGTGDDTLAGGFGVDEVRGNAGDDTMTGSAFSDLIFGGPGFDFVNGGFGFDRVNGGDDADRFFHTGDAGHGSDWIQDYDAAEGDVLLYGGQAQPDQFRVITTETRNAGQAGVEEAFVVHTQTGQILWALVDGGGQDAINLSLGGQLVDLFG